MSASLFRRPPKKSNRRYAPGPALRAGLRYAAYHCCPRAAQVMFVQLLQPGICDGIPFVARFLAPVCLSGPLLACIARSNPTELCNWARKLPGGSKLYNVKWLQSRLEINVHMCPRRSA